MIGDELLQAEASQTIKSPKFGPDLVVNLNSDLFLAEYNSLRGEIVQRLGQQTTIYQIAITAFGLIIGYALEKVDETIWHNDVILISVYPLLAFLLAYAWSFNQIRICQIAQYLRVREEQFTKAVGLIWWENYIITEPSIRKESQNPYPQLGKSKPGFMILSGTQFASIATAGAMFVIHLTAMKSEEYISSKTALILIFLSVDIILSYKTYIMINRSGGS
jgi:hypothetical protein